MSRAGFWKYTFCGYITNEPKLEEGKFGRYLMINAVANRSRKGNDDEWVETADWVTFFVKGKRAEAIAKFIHKGMMVISNGNVFTAPQEIDGKNITRHLFIPNFAMDGLILVTPEKRAADPSHAEVLGYVAEAEGQAQPPARPARAFNPPSNVEPPAEAFAADDVDDLPF